MKHIAPIVLLLLLCSCGKTAGKLLVRDRTEQSLTLALEAGERVTFWTNSSFAYEDHMDVYMTVQVMKNDSVYKSFQYNPLHTNPTYLSSKEQWYKYRERNPEWIRPKDRLWEYEYMDGKFIKHYGTKVKRKGKNTPVLDITETGFYTFKAKLTVYTEHPFEIHRADLVLRRETCSRIGL